MSPWLILVVLLTGLFALLPTRRLADRSGDRWTVGLYFLAMWLLIAAAVAVPAVRRVAIPLALLLGILPWLTLRPGLDRLLRRPPVDRRPPPRNVTPPDA